MTEDDDDTGGIDLAAWEAPEPPAGIADAVVARLREPVGAAALDAPVTRARTRRLVGGGVLAVAATAGIAAFAYSALRGEDASTGSGFVATAKPSHVELGPVSAADVEANTDLWWVRDGHRIVAMQPRGTATWKAAANDTLVIDAGAAVASVEASGASLRVEVQMNLSDARVIGASALTAAAVAMVTVVVYEGHVTVSGGGHTVNVAPGGIVEVRPGLAPSEPVMVGVDKLESERRRLLGELDRQPTTSDRETAEHARLQAELALKDAEIRELKRTIDELNHLKRDPFTPSTVDPISLDSAIKARHGELQKCGNGFKGTIIATVKIDPSGAVSEVVTEPAGAVGTCVAGIIRTLKLGASAKPTTVRYPIVLSGPCDFDALVAKGEASIPRGQHQAALLAFEAALACKPDASVTMKAYMAACNAKNAVKARGYFARIPPDRQPMLAQICLRNGLDPRAGVAGTLDRATAASCQPADHVDPFDDRPVCGTNPGVSRATKTGVLRVSSRSPAEIVIDGVATRKRAPASFDLTPGKHKVTFVVGDDRFTFVATIKAGEVLSMHKDLQ